MKIALIIARKNSKRIPNKNKKIFCGKPLIYWPIQTLKRSKIFDKIYLSTDDVSISKIAKKYGVEIPFIREKKLSGTKTSTIAVVKDFINKIKKKKIKINSLCCVYGSAPFFTVNDLKIAYSRLNKLKKDFSFVATPIDKIILRSFIVNKNQINLINKKYVNYRSQELPNCYIDAGQFYWGNKETWLKKKKIFTTNSCVIVKKIDSCIDINDKKDWKKAVEIFKKNGKI